MDKKTMLGPKVRRLRQDLNLTQAEMAERMGISASYLNLIEHNQRPVTVPVLLRLGKTFDIDLQEFARDEESQLADGLTEVFADPLFDDTDLRRRDIRDLAAQSPELARAVITLYGAWRHQTEDFRAMVERVADEEKLDGTHPTPQPLEAVRDYFNSSGNYFPDLEAAAEALWEGADLKRGDLWRGLTLYLEAALGVRTRVLPAETMGAAIRRYDYHGRQLLLSELLSPAKRRFQVACQIAYLAHGDLLDRMLEAGGPGNPEARWAARLGLANYFAAAVLMPYAPFLAAARHLRYDIELLQHRFEVSFEQVCHRLTTLQRPGEKGVPFFLIRVDKAGNVSKRFSAAAFPFARFGGACPRYIVYDAFRVPGVIKTQISEMPDGTRFFSVARTVQQAAGGFHEARQQFSVALGCALEDAREMVYADGQDLGTGATAVAMPIGVNCRLCERMDCSQRAHPPLRQRLQLDEHIRGFSPFAFAGAPDKRAG